MSLTMMFLGSGSAFTNNENNFHSNVLFTHNEDTLLLDAGSDLRFSLNLQEKSYHDIRNVFISHLHADHIGGMEWLALSTFFDNSYLGKPRLFIAEALVNEIWNKSLAGGLSTLLNQQSDLETYFDVHTVRDEGKFVWQGIDFTLIQMIHVFNNFQLVPCYGLLFNYRSTRILYTADTQYVPHQLSQLYEEADIIFHDCETSKVKSGVHTHYEELLLIPHHVRKKIWLYHYNPGKLPDAKADGFCGFVTRGQCFTF